ncbi:DNA-3-methyladenine glycosylase 2 family protein [Ancylobacter sp. 6x-1]|uniref:DNA-3-methyladenine glycosylase II n=1 Tax=Ancylobacter crimeensis TaxID=2579147 RepID=A0ABT0DDQ8_9HYPH|nr:DNA-3-methyladenine glycosylase 2 family protein [Ancylobacter crimeensis]MCK0198078.1 DNA-3-methyladenine glycosylase 2 family protein [Ancylobacter crimeensis]
MGARETEETLADQPAFLAAVDRLVGLDARFGAIREACGVPALRRRPGGFPGLAAIILAQQVSTASARAITARLESACGGAITPETVLALREEGLAAVGLSRPKIRSTLGIAARLAAGEADLAAIDVLPSAAAAIELMRLPGVGPWTAEVYLLFALGRADAFPAGDLALQVAAAEAFGLRGRCSALELTALAEGWRPLRGVAAQMLWAAYAAPRGRQAVPA